MQAAGHRKSLRILAVAAPAGLAVLLLCAALLTPRDIKRAECAWAGLVSATDVFGFAEARQLANEIAGGIKDGSLRTRRYEEGGATEFTPYAAYPSG